MSADLTLDAFKRALPTNMSKTVSQDIVDQVNLSLTDPIVRETMRDNIIGYTTVIRDGRFSVTNYIDAVKYVTYKLMGDSNVVAYSKTFPDRYQRLVNLYTTSKDISSYVSAYNKNKLVNLVLEQTLVPSHIYNMDLYQRALNTQADLMANAKSEKVRTDAANSILNQLKMPETKKIELDIGFKEDKTLEDLKNTTLELVAQQKKMIASGAAGAGDIADSKIINGEFEEI
jgi:hypothetical protein